MMIKHEHYDNKIGECVKPNSCDKCGGDCLALVYMNRKTGEFELADSICVDCLNKVAVGN